VVCGLFSATLLTLLLLPNLYYVIEARAARAAERRQRRAAESGDLDATGDEGGQHSAANPPH
jgi:cobalt-zinc-cadmium resistance protein CzcA